MWLAVLLAQTIVPLEAISAPAQSLKFYLRTMPSLLKKLPTRHSSHPLLERHARLLRVLCASEHTQTWFFFITHLAVLRLMRFTECTVTT